MLSFNPGDFQNFYGHFIILQGMNFCEILENLTNFN